VKKIKETTQTENKEQKGETQKLSGLAVPPEPPRKPDFVIKRKSNIHINRTLLMSILLPIIVPIIVCLVMVPQMAPGKGLYNADMTRISSNITGLDSRLNSVQTLASTTSAEFTAMNIDVNANTAGISVLHGNATTLNDRLDIIETNIASRLPNSLVDAHLAGTFGNYTLTAKSSDAGNFTARLTMVYNLTPVAVNVTEDEALVAFYTTWITALDEDYIPSLVYDTNSTQWYVSQVSFHTPKFELEAGNEASLNITFEGLIFTPDFSYVEVFPVI
jgi:hypothetical protein